MATAVAPEVSAELKAFFADIVLAFWVLYQDGPLALQLPEDVEPGSLHEAILRAHGVCDGDLGEQVRQLEQAFPEMKDHIWKECSHETTPQAVNEFLVSNVVERRLYQTFKRQTEVMLQEQALRQNR